MSLAPKCHQAARVLRIPADGVQSGLTQVYEAGMGPSKRRTAGPIRAGLRLLEGAYGAVLAGLGEKEWLGYHAYRDFCLVDNPP